MDPTTERKPRTYSASEFALDDFLNESVTLPEDTVTVFTDGKAAWRYNELVSEHEAVHARIAELVRADPDDSVRSIVDNETPVAAPEDLDELDRIDREMQETMAAIKASALTIKMRAMYPFEYKNTTNKAKRIANEHFKGEATPTDDERAEYESDTFVIESFIIEMLSISFPNGDEVNGPFSADQLRKIMGKLNTHEWSKLIRLHVELNTRAAIRDASADAGFPG